MSLTKVQRLEHKCCHQVHKIGTFLSDGLSTSIAFQNMRCDIFLNGKRLFTSSNYYGHTKNSVPNLNPPKRREWLG